MFRIILDPLNWPNTHIDILWNVNKGARPRKIHEGSIWHNLHLSGPIFTVFNLVQSPLLILRYKPNKGKSYIVHELLNTIDANKLIKLDISFVKLITDAWLINRLPNYIVIFFSSYNGTKCLIQLINIHLSLKRPYLD